MVRMITETGLHFDMSSVDYFADPCPQPSLTQSIAKVLIDHSALHAHAEHPRLAVTADEDEDAEKYVKAQAIGNAAHAVMIGRGKTLAVANFDNWKKKEAQDFRDEAIAGGKTAILSKHLECARRMVLAANFQIVNAFNILKEPALDKAFKEGAGEVVAAAAIDGIWMRSLIDWVVDPRLLFDFKTTGMSVAPQAIPQLMANAGWPIQAATQERILDVIDPEGMGRRRFFFIAQENWKPYALTIHELPESTMTMGRKMLAKAEAMWREATKLNRWDGYPVAIHHPEYPQYAEAKWLAREIEDHDRNGGYVGVDFGRRPSVSRGPMLTDLAGG